MVHIKYTVVCIRIIFIHKVKWITYMLLWSSMPHFFKRQKHTIQMLLKLAARVNYFLKGLVAKLHILLTWNILMIYFYMEKRTFQTVCTLWPHFKIFLFSIYVYTQYNKFTNLERNILNLKYDFFLGSGIRVIFIFISFSLFIYIFWQRILLHSTCGFLKSYI